MCLRSSKTTIHPSPCSSSTLRTSCMPRSRCPGTTTKR
jgi:hypothetical protein